MMKADKTKNLCKTLMKDVKALPKEYDDIMQFHAKKAMFAADTYIPYINGLWICHMIEIAKELNILDLFILGGIFHPKADMQVMEDPKVAKAVETMLTLFTTQFNNVYFLLGLSHIKPGDVECAEDRARYGTMKESEKYQEMLANISAAGKIHLMPHEIVYVNNNWVVGDIRSQSRVKGRVPMQIAEDHGRDTIVAYRHHVGYETNNTADYRCFCVGGLNMLPNKKASHQQPFMPKGNNGFITVVNNEAQIWDDVNTMRWKK